MIDKYMIQNIDELNVKIGDRKDDKINYIICDLMQREFGEGFSSIIATSGGEKSALLPYHVRASVPTLNVPIVFVDHYFHTKETYEHIDKMETMFGNIHRYFPLLSKEEMAGMGFPPQPVSQEEFMKGDKETIDKVMRFMEFQHFAKGEPAKRILEEYRKPGRPLIIFNGRTKFQAEEGRNNLRWLEHSGNGIYRVHPLLEHSESQITSELKKYGLPRNKNHSDPSKGINLECSLNTVI